MSETSDDVDLYALLGVRSDATFTEIKSAWRIMALTAHPDKGGSEELMKNLNKAKITLFDPANRAEYDYKYDANNDTIFAGMKKGEKLSEMFQKRFDEWINEFHTFNFVDNFDNLKMYKNLFELSIEDLRKPKPKTGVPSYFTQNKNATVKVLRGWMHEFCKNKDGYLKKISKLLREYGDTNSVIKQLYNSMRIEREILKDTSIFKEIGKGTYLHRFDAALLLLKGHYLGCESNYKASLEAFQDAVMVLPSDEVHSAVASLLYAEHIKAMIASLAEEVTVNDVLIPANYEYCNHLKSCSPLTYDRAIQSGKSRNVAAALHYIDLCTNLHDSTMVCSIYMLASTFFFQEMKLFQVDKSVSATNQVTLPEMYQLRNGIRDLCISTTSRAKKLIHPVTQLHYIKRSFNLSRLSNDLFRSACIASRKSSSHKSANLMSHDKPILEVAHNKLIEALNRSLSRLLKLT